MNHSDFDDHVKFTVTFIKVIHPFTFLFFTVLHYHVEVVKVRSSIYIYHENSNFKNSTKLNN